MLKNSLLVLGLMSGTSADGIEAALVRISGAPPKLKSKLEGHASLPIPKPIRAAILRVAEGTPFPAAEISQLNFRLGHLFADAAIATCKKLRVSLKSVDLIASHGQTIFHQGQPIPYLGARTSSTLQIGEASVIAARTGITTIGDFRPADMAAGGQGAPLVPFADYLLYCDEKIGRVSLNLGGIANVTVIPAHAKPSDVFAFDTGPANILIDALVAHFTKGRQRFDADGALAKRGQISLELMRTLLRDPYLRRRPPKSTGREYFGRDYVRELIALGRRYRLSPNDLICTTTMFSANSVIDALHRFVFPKHKINEIIVSGGGAQNPVLMQTLSVFAMAGSNPRDFYRVVRPREVRIVMTGAHSPGNPTLAIPKHELIFVRPSSIVGVPTEAKEAYAFALLAHETFHHRPSNLPSATGAARPAILGKISYP
ncbi:MAG TPA: anhydro-N-acetylmuramic acid kinase [Candidatus Acidoferrum sp.]|nr:anhydro-N-acetylmuramic acid kinase [Candidatus Acidoferrum sp.]